MMANTDVAPTRTARAHYSARPSHAHMATKKIAVVTGANKGIGFAVAKHLCVLFMVYCSEVRTLTREQCCGPRHPRDYYCT